MKLSDSIEEYQSSRVAQGYARNTVRASQQALDLLLLTVGNINVKHLDARHGEAFVAAMLAKGFKPGTVNLYRGAFTRFCKWLHQRRLLPGGSNPTATTRNLTVAPAPRRRIPSRDFSRLLDCAAHPQERAIMALGLYLFLRASEISDLDVEHVDLQSGMVRVYQRKTSRWDEMPVCAELDAELRRWLTWYAEDQAALRGPLQPHWPLVPARRRSQLWGNYPAPQERRGQVNPTSRSKQIHTKVQAALTRFGWEVGPEHREGVHTLRRSGARALYEELVKEGGEARDEAVGIVQSMLHHRSRSITEHYIGLEAAREKRDRIFAGRAMFARADDANVIPLSSNA